MFILYILATCFLAIIINCIIKHKNFNKKLNGFKGPKPIPILGNALEFKSPLEILSTISKFHKEHGGIVLLRIGFLKTLLSVADCDFLEFIVNSNELIDKSEDYHFFKDWLGTGLFIANTKLWKKQRKMLTPAFHSKILEIQVQQFQNSNKVFIKKLNQLCNSKSKVIDVFPLIRLWTLETIYESALGVPINIQESENNTYLEAINTMLEVYMRRHVSVLKQFNCFYKLSKDYSKEKAALEVLHKTTNDLIKKKRQNAYEKNKSFLDLLLEYEIDGITLTDVEIRQEIDGIMFGGHDTVSTAISFALYSISKNPNIQAKVLQEIHDVLGTDNNNPTYNQLQELKYLEMVIKESLRLYPSGYMFGRRVNEDMEYKGFVLPKGLTLTCNVYEIHRDPKNYPDPEKFDPERFTPENESKRNPYSYVPFSAGQRNCLGQKFAMFSMKATISTIVKHFELLPAEPDIVLVAAIILKSLTGVHIEFKKRI